MREKPFRFLWLEGVFDEATVANFPSISPASNFWQKGFVRALQGLGHGVDVIGYPVEQAWPFGRLMIHRSGAALLPGIAGRVVGYVNIPFLRAVFQYLNMRWVVARHLRSAPSLPDYLVVFSCLEKPTDQTAALRVARHVRRARGVPWVCIVADGQAPPGADAYVYLPWAYYKLESAQRQEPTIHIDGGVPEVPARADAPSPQREKVLMYMGALTAHGGALELAKSFQGVADQGIALWFCGRGGNPELDDIATKDGRIHVKGFLEESELNALAARAFAFANPRPTAFAPNKFNYPSKLLHYLAFGKPVISTFTDGVSPEYEKVLLPIDGDSEAGLRKAIEKVMSLDEAQYDAWQARIAVFNENRSWPAQAERFVVWLRREVAQI